MSNSLSLHWYKMLPTWTAAPHNLQGESWTSDMQFVIHLWLLWWLPCNCPLPLRAPLLHGDEIEHLHLCAEYWKQGGDFCYYNGFCIQQKGQSLSKVNISSLPLRHLWTFEVCPLALWDQLGGNCSQLWLERKHHFVLWSTRWPTVQHDRRTMTFDVF